TAPAVVPGAPVPGVPAPVPTAPGQPAVASPVPTGPAPKLTFNPAQVQAATNGQFAVDAILSDVTDIKEGLAVLQFDAKALKLVKITPGPMLAPDGLTTPPGMKAEDGMFAIKFKVIPKGSPDRR